jgi:hypothetical protein
MGDDVDFAYQTRAYNESYAARPSRLANASPELPTEDTA